MVDIAAGLPMLPRLFSDPTAAPPLLPRLSIDPAKISIMGFSSGAGFATSQCVAFSSVYSGCGFFAAEPYHCDVQYWPGDELMPGINPACPLCDGCPTNTTLKTCSCNWPKGSPKEDKLDVGVLIRHAEAVAAQGKIDDVKHLKGSRIFIHQGLHDQYNFPVSTSNTSGPANSKRFFDAFGADVQIKITNSSHAWPLDGFGTPCGKAASFLESCGYDAPGAMLQHAHHGELSPPVPRGEYVNTSLTQFSQVPFYSEDNLGTHGAGLATFGYVYVPSRCREANAMCALHLSLHGCSEKYYYDYAVVHLGLLEWGEANGIVILFPQITPHGTTGEEKIGCFDTYGQKGPDYDQKSGTQMTAVRSMVAAVAGV